MDRLGGCWAASSIRNPGLQRESQQADRLQLVEQPLSASVPLLPPVQARVRLYKLVIEEPVPPLDQVHALAEQQPDDVPHDLFGHSIGVEGPRVLVRVGVDVINGLSIAILVHAYFEVNFFILEARAMPRMICLRGASL